MRVFLIIVFILFLIVAAFVGFGVYVYMNLDNFVEQAIEQIGTEATGTTVAINDVDIEIVQGTAAIHGFTVDNPAGFSDGDVFALNQISITLDPANTSEGLITLTEVVIDNPQVLYEFGENGTNIDAIRSNIQAFQNRVGGAGGSRNPQEAKIIINRLRFTGGTVVAMAGGEQVNVDLPPLTLTDLGRASGGETAGQIAAQVGERFARHVSETVARAEVERRLGIEGGIVDRVRDLFGN